MYGHHACNRWWDYNLEQFLCGGVYSMVGVTIMCGHPLPVNDSSHTPNLECE